MFPEIVKFIICLTLIVIISKYILVKFLRKMAESLNLKPNTVGNIAGFTTSVPELLTTCTASIAGLSIATIYNIISSNIINLVQYLGTVIINKNAKQLKNKAIRANIIIVLITIIIPIVLVITKKESDFTLVPFLIITYILSLMLNKSMHKLYLKKEDKKLEKIIEKDIKKEKKNKKVLFYCIILIFTAILVFIIGQMLEHTLETLCELFNVSQILIGIILGFFTSIPELITFFESQRHHKSQNSDYIGMIEATNSLMMSNTMNLFVIFTLGIIIASIVN